MIKVGRLFILDLHLDLCRKDIAVHKLLYVANGVHNSELQKYESFTGKSNPGFFVKVLEAQSCKWPHFEARTRPDIYF